MDGLLYAVGGSSNTETHNSVECYDPESDTWSNIKPMHTRRLGVGVAVVNRYVSELLNPNSKLDFQLNSMIYFTDYCTPLEDMTVKNV